MVRLNCNDYTVGWLCALPKVELPAAIKMLEKSHDAPLRLPLDDDNTYAYGTINGHNVVIASMPPGMPGKVSALQLARPLSRSFPNMRIHLFVGIGGGVPCSEVDIRLGDVVVGWAERTGEPGVVQYDLIERRGEEAENQKLLSTMDKPDRRLLNALGMLMSRHITRERHFSEHLQRLQGLPEFVSPGPENDHLFPATYSHRGGSTCSSCDQGQKIERQSREFLDRPNFYQGTILSGDSVMNDAKKRDELSKKYYNAICFEMEAAGVMDDKHCLVIRGIADYSDAHKNQSWQMYAAATAAAFATEFLYTIQPNTISELPEVTETALVRRNTKLTANPSSNACSSSQKPILPGEDTRLPEGESFRVVSEPQEGRVQLVFVHGMTGDKDSTWTHKDTNFYWPRSIVGDIRSACVTTFGYDANPARFWSSTKSNSLVDSARGLLRFLSKHRKSHKNHLPIIFIAHGFGGYICEQALVLYRESPEDRLWSSVCGLIFLDTAHSGQLLQTPALALKTYFNGYKWPVPQDALSSWPSTSSLLPCLENEFEVFLQDNNHPIQILNYTRTQNSQQSCEKWLPSGRLSNHADMVEFHGKDDPRYESIVDTIRRWMYIIET